MHTIQVLLWLKNVTIKMSHYYGTYLSGGYFLSPISQFIDSH